MSDGLDSIVNSFKSLSSKMRRRRKLNSIKIRKYVHGTIKIDDERKYFQFGKNSSRMRKMKDGSMHEYLRDDDDDGGHTGSKEFFLAGACLNDLYITKILDKRIKSGLNTHIKQENFVCGQRPWVEFVRTHYNTERWHVIEFGESAGMIIDWKALVFIDYTANSNSVEVKFYGDHKEIEPLYEAICKTFSVATCHVEWVYAGDGSSVEIPLLGEKLPITEMYPFLKNESLESYYDRFMQSSASILLLLGPPGTGKTTFIRGLLHYTRKNAIITYDEKLLEKDYVFSRFIEDDVSVMIIEDADNFLRSRKEGNSMMHRFLNVGDGLITVKGKKLIFSTNLPSIKDVDAALVRPGRCFDILQFNNYTPEEAKTLASKINIELKENKKEYSLAEIFHQQTYFPSFERKVGFI